MDWKTGGGGGVYGVAGLGVMVSRVNAGGGGGIGTAGVALDDATSEEIGDANDCGDAKAGRDELAAFSLVPHSSQYSEPSRLSVPQ
ncbi:MAG: hypothetical protein ABI977_19965 [Acidobacteriota bacterium]